MYAVFISILFDIFLPLTDVLEVQPLVLFWLSRIQWNLCNLLILSYSGMIDKQYRPFMNMHEVGGTTLMIIIIQHVFRNED